MSGSFNGKTGEFVRFLIGVGTAALVAYYTTINAINVRIAVVETNEKNHYTEVKDVLGEIKEEQKAQRLMLQQALSPIPEPSTRTPVFSRP